MLSKAALVALCLSAASELLDLIGVSVSNDWTYAGAIENPWTAHTSYWQTREVMRIVKCGIGAAAQGCD